MFKPKPKPKAAAASQAKQKHYPEEISMEETLSLILHGCKLAKDLESNLIGNLGNYQPEILFKSCEEIIRVFTSAKERLNAQVQLLHLQQSHHQSQSTSPDQQQELLKYGVIISQAMDMIQQQLLAGKSSSSEMMDVNQEMAGVRNMEMEAGYANIPRLNPDSGRASQAMDVSDSGRASSSSSQRTRRRKDDEDKCTMTVPAPQMGNTDLPPEDNYTWRKYGQKEILGSRYPRAYYRCTHQKMYNCPAKKQVQRLDNDFYTFEVTYIGQHTCHMSSTAPSIPPPLTVERGAQLDHPLIMTQSMATYPTTTPTPTPPAGPAASSIGLGRWLSMEFSLASGGSSSGSGGAGGSTATASRYGGRAEHVEYPGVADMADVMFNSGSSSSNSMDFIFPLGEDKWEAEPDKKKPN